MFCKEIRACFTLVGLTERGARRAGVRAAPAAALPMLPPPQPAVTLSRPPRPDRSSRRSHRAPPAADVAPRLLQLRRTVTVIEACESVQASLCALEVTARIPDACGVRGCSHEQSASEHAC